LAGVPAHNSLRPIRLPGVSTPPAASGFDHRPVQYDSSHSDERAVMQMGGVHDRAVADGDIVSDVAFHPLAWIYVQHRRILHIAARADAYPVGVAAQHAVEPDAGAHRDFHIANDHGGWGDPGIRMELRENTVQRP
jgi:hypothetical protein